jgi:hypothetical protein
MACCYRGTVTARASTSGAVASARRSHAAPAGPLLSTPRRGCLSLINKMLFCKPVNVPFAPLALPALASSPSPFLCSAACSGAREHHLEQALEEEACDFVDSWSDDKRARFFAKIGASVRSLPRQRSTARFFISTLAGQPVSGRSLFLWLWRAFDVLSTLENKRRDFARERSGPSVVFEERPLFGS